MHIYEKKLVIFLATIGDITQPARSGDAGMAVGGCTGWRGVSGIGWCLERNVSTQWDSYARVLVGNVMSSTGGPGGCVMTGAPAMCTLLRDAITQPRAAADMDITQPKWKPIEL